jgi:hypothetical protein
MRSEATPRFWELFHELPTEVQRLAVESYRLWRVNPNHPSLWYRRLEGRDNLATDVSVITTVRWVCWSPESWVWIWIGPHAEYNRLIRG